MLVREDQQVREVASGQKQGSGVRHEDAAVQKAQDIGPAPAGDEDEHRCQERDARVEVQKDGDRRHEEHRRQVEREIPTRQTVERSGRSGEDAVLVGHRADEQEARNENERRPRVCRSIAKRGGLERDRNDRADDARCNQDEP